MTYIFRHPGIVADRLGEHLLLTLISLAIALAIAFPLGVLVARKPRAGAITLAILNAIYTVPSLALLAILVAVFGLGTPTAIVALVAYAQMILVRNIAEGLRGVSPAALDAADGLGFTRFERLVRVEIPLALPAIVGGIRIATVSLIGIATIAAWIDAGGLGELVFQGLHQDDPEKIVAGSLAAVALALVADGALRLAERAAAERQSMKELFAYGTLRDAEYQAALFGSTLPTRPATLHDWLAVVAESGYFTIVRAPGETVEGDLVTLDDAQLELADAWEDVEYERLEVTVRDALGSVEACVYARPTASRERVPPGSLAAHPRQHVLERIRILRSGQ